MRYSRSAAVLLICTVRGARFRRVSDPIVLGLRTVAGFHPETESCVLVKSEWLLCFSILGMSVSPEWAFAHLTFVSSDCPVTRLILDDTCFLRSGFLATVFQELDSQREQRYPLSIPGANVDGAS